MIHSRVCISGHILTLCLHGRLCPLCTTEPWGCGRSTSKGGGPPQPPPRGRIAFDEGKLLTDQPAESRTREPSQLLRLFNRPYKSHKIL